MTHVVSIKSNYKNGICFVFNFIVIHSNCCRMGTLRLAAIVNAKKELIASFLRLFLRSPPRQTLQCGNLGSQVHPTLASLPEVSSQKVLNSPSTSSSFYFLLIKFIYLFYIQTAASPSSTFPVFLPPSLCHH